MVREVKPLSYKSKPKTMMDAPEFPCELLMGRIYKMARFPILSRATFPSPDVPSPGQCKVSKITIQSKSHLFQPLMGVW